MRRHKCEQCGVIFECVACNAMLVMALDRRDAGEPYEMDALYCVQHSPKFKFIEPWLCQDCKSRRN